MQWEPHMGSQLHFSFQKANRTVPLILAGWGILWQSAASSVLALLHSCPAHRFHHYTSRCKGYIQPRQICKHFFLRELRKIFCKRIQQKCDFVALSHENEIYHSPLPQWQTDKANKEFLQHSNRIWSWKYWLFSVLPDLYQSKGIMFPFWIDL